MLSPHVPALINQNSTATSLDRLLHHPRPDPKCSDRSSSAPIEACQSQDSPSPSVTVISESEPSSALDYQRRHAPTHGPLPDQVAKFKSLLWPDSASWTSPVLYQSTAHEAHLDEEANFVDLARLVKIGFKSMGSFNLSHMQLFPDGKQEICVVPNTLLQGGTCTQQDPRRSLHMESDLIPLKINPHNDFMR